MLLLHVVILVTWQIWLILFLTLPFCRASNLSISYFPFFNALKPLTLGPSLVIYPLSNVPFHFATSRCTKDVGDLVWTNVHISEANNLRSCLKTPPNCSQAAPFVVFVSTNIQQFFFRYTNIDFLYTFASTYT